MDNEPADREDVTMRGFAATLGIIPGHPFSPDSSMVEILDAAAAVGERHAATIAFALTSTFGSGPIGDGPAT